MTFKKQINKNRHELDLTLVRSNGGIKTQDVLPIKNITVVYGEDFVDFFKRIAKQNIDNELLQREK